MFKEIFLFELRYRKGRAINYIYFALIFVFCFLSATSPNDPMPALVSPNATYFLGLYTPLISFVFIMITSAIMGVAITRDFDHHTEAILFTTALKENQYLLGRFAGSMVVLILINCGTWIGFLAGFYLAGFMPWHVGWTGKTLVPFNFWSYLQPFLIFSITNLFTMGALFFMWGALTRKSIVIYTQGILLLILYQVSYIFLHDMDFQFLAALIDPFGVQTVQHITRYWSPDDQNHKLLSLDGVLLYNRLLWVGVGLIALIVTCSVFSFDAIQRKWRKVKEPKREPVFDRAATEVPVSTRTFDYPTKFQQLFKMTFFYGRIVSRDIPFIAMILTGLLLLVVRAVQFGMTYGNQTLPTTSYVLQAFESFNSILLIVAIYYSGDLVWKERSVKINMITAALPVSSFITLSSKFLALLLLYILLLLLLVAGGVLIQFFHHYTDFDLPAYFTTIFCSTLSTLVLYTVLSFFIQIVLNSKFLGFSVGILFIIVTASLVGLGLENDLYRFASGTLGTLSAMNGYGHFISPFIWLKVYWISLAGVLFGLSIAAYNDGSQSGAKARWQSFKANFKLPVAIATGIFFLIFVSSGAWIQHNSILNSPQNQADKETIQPVQKSDTLIVQPVIISTDVQIELYPSQRSFTVNGYYYLKNTSSEAIHQLYIRPGSKDPFSHVSITFDWKTTPQQSDINGALKIVDLPRPMNPGDSLKIAFRNEFASASFGAKDANVDVVYNGTLISNDYFPRVGYERSNINGKCSVVTHQRLNITVGTDSDQTAVAPGHLEKKWSQNNRNYFTYHAKASGNMYTIASARYALFASQWNNVLLQVYHHPAHSSGLNRMIQSMKEALEYNTANFGPYHAIDLSILEFPGYTRAVEPNAGMISLAENKEFIFAEPALGENIDMVKYNVWYATSRQWWDGKVAPAHTAGRGMLSNGLAHYTALMMMKHAYGPGQIGDFMKHTLDVYMNAHLTERKEEAPLLLVANQSYVQDNKASLAFYYLQDMITEDSLNAAFRRYAKKSMDCAPTSLDLMKEIRKVTPDSLGYLVHDLFEVITLFENKGVDAVFHESSKNKFEVTINVSAEKFQADKNGQETNITLNDWMDIGIYATDEKGNDRLIYLKKHRITRKNSTFVIAVKEQPSRAGIDPLHKLVDKHSADNIVHVTRVINIGDVLVQ